MKVLDLSFSDPHENLACDDDLLMKADKAGGGEILRFWEAPCIFAVLGRACDEGADVDLDACRRDNIPVLRRSSGGGTVLQGPGCYNFSLVLSKTRHPDLNSITRSYEHILGHVMRALALCGVEAGFRPVCDLVIPGSERKFSGNAQRRGRTHILHHGTILYNFDLPVVSRYLRMPPSMPDYRCSRPHADFITNINVDIPSFKKALSASFKSL